MFLNSYKNIKKRFFYIYGLYKYISGQRNILRAVLKALTDSIVCMFAGGVGGIEQPTTLKSNLLQVFLITALNTDLFHKFLQY